MNQFSASLWGDESFAAVLAQKPLNQIISLVSHDTSPPLYYLFLHLWMKVFGTSEISIRSLSFLFFLLTVIVLYFFGKALRDKKTGLWAAILTFLNPFLFSYSFEGRMYSLLALTTTASMYFFFKKQWKLYILATTAALYTHHFALFAIFVQILWLLKPALKSFGSFWKNFWPLITVGVLYLPWLYPLYRQTTLVASGFWLGKPDFQSLSSLFENFFLGQQDYPLKGALWVSLILILLLRQWPKNWKNDLFLISWFTVPVFLTFLISHFASASIFFERYLLFTIPAAILLLASWQRIISYPFLILTVSILLSVNYTYFAHPVKRPFKELANYVKQEKKEDDFLINYNTAAHHLFESKYYGLSAPIYSPGGPLPFYTGTALMATGDVIEALPANIQGRVGVIGSGDNQVVNLPGYNLLEAKRFGDLFFLWFTPEKSII